MEIERKFLIEALPDGLEAYQKLRIEQAYLSTSPVVRIRRMDESYILTCKGNGLMMREEQEMSISQVAYQKLLPKAKGNLIAKDRYLIPHGEYMIELDIFDPPLAPLMIAEVEFSTEKEAGAFIPPAWFGQDVTFDSAYTNATLSGKSITDMEIKPGRYRHFKGKEYEVLYTAIHSETEEPMVVYRALYGEQGIWVRPASMWNEFITHEGKEVARFSFIGDAEVL